MAIHEATLRSEALTNIFRIEVRPRLHEHEIANAGWVAAIHLAGFESVVSCASARLFFCLGDLTRSDAERLASRLLADPVTETCAIFTADQTPQSANDDHTIEVTLLPGVTDPVGESLIHAAHQIGIMGLKYAATGQQYQVAGNLTHMDLQALAVKVFSNSVIQRCEIDQPISPPFVAPSDSNSTVEEIIICGATDDVLLAISAERRLALDLAEMGAIRTYFESENRNPTDLELEMLAQTWSEHCIHKTFRATIDFTGPDGQSQCIDSLLKTYLRAATDQLAKPWVHSAFVDNAGIISFDDNWDLAFKVETHNHPSALEPFGGANTGVGGVVRDVLGVSARPIANTDVLCFGPQELSDSDLPAGVLHPRRVQDGVVRGVQDYGNKMGIPTVNGAIQYHPGYTANPLVFCGCLGLLPRGSHPVGAEPDDLIVVLGGRTGRDGLRGATFSSMEMDQTTGDIAGTAVQIGHPINEKQVLEVVLQARDENLYHAITDCGAGGLSSAVGEMAAEIGADVQLAHVPLKYPGLRPWEIWLSEAQERMVLAIPPEHAERFAAICTGHDIEAVSIGTFTGSGRITLHYADQRVGDLDARFLHDGIPTRHLEAIWQPAPAIEPQYPANPDYAADLLALLAHPNIRSKESVIRRYDHEVQGATAVKPLVGAADHGPSDAAVIVPLGTPNGSDGNRFKGAVLSVGMCPQYGEIDPYAMAWAAVDEAVRNAVAVGADPDQIAILDNFCWGNPNVPDRLGSLVRAAQGCHDAALAYGTPFISGKDSLNNEYTGADGKKHAIPGTLLISALGIVPDVRRTVTMDLKQPGNLLYLIGETHDEMGGSHYHMVHRIEGGTVPQTKNPARNQLAPMQVLHKAIQKGIIASCHDCSEGGLAVALAEMCIAGRLGARLVFSETNLRAKLFSESTSRFIVEVPEDRLADFIDTMIDVRWTAIGKVREDDKLVLELLTDRSPRGEKPEYIVTEKLFEIGITDLESAFRGDLPIASDASVNPAPKSLDTSRDFRVTQQHTPRILILHARGTNRDRDAALACELAGATPEIVTVHQLMHGERSLLDYSMLVIPGGFSFGDDLGAGVLWATMLNETLGEDLQQFVASGRPVLGICNGFQTLVKAGLLPGAEFSPNTNRPVTLTHNERGDFECRWVYLKPNPASPSIFTQGLDNLIHCPIAHGEGRIAASNPTILEQLQQQNLIALTYVDAAGNPGYYPVNPNGSLLNIAALTNPTGNVLGLMPHPEDHIFPWQHPRWRRGEGGMLGLRLFENAIRNM